MFFRWLYFLLLSATLSGVSAQQNDNELSLGLEGWRLVTDGVMGGVSEGRFRVAEVDGQSCLHLAGEVSTRNNGGFIQMARDLDEREQSLVVDYRGVMLRVKGNAQDYNVHLRTGDLWFPWQAYRATFPAGAEWSSLKIPFDSFTPYKTSSGFDPARLERIGIVAIGRDFSADVCVAEVGFYR